MPNKPKAGKPTVALDYAALASSRRDQQAELVFKLKTDRSRDRSRGHRPLAKLAAKEVELREISTARAQLLAVHNKAADPTLLAFQISASVNTQHASGHLAKQMQADARRLYAALQSGDPSRIHYRPAARCLNQRFDGFVAARGSPWNDKVRQVELRSGMKGAEVVGNLIKLRDGRRGAGHQNVTVGSLKVESGGQAIVGNVNGKKREDEA